MSTQLLRKKIRVLDSANFGIVLRDILTMYIGETRGEELPESDSMTELLEALVLTQKRQYLSELPKKQPKVVQRDLEDLIKEVKDGTGK